MTIGVKIIGVASLLAATCMFGGDAHAAPTDPDSSYPGAICQTWFQNSDKLLHANFGSVYNAHTSALTVTCPVVRKNPVSSNGIQFAAVYVNNPAGQTTQCWLYSNDVNKTTITYQTRSVTASGFQAMYFDGPTTSAVWGNYVLQCNLPVSGYLNSYYVYENY